MQFIHFIMIHTFVYLLLLTSMALAMENIGCYIEGDCSGGPLVAFSTEGNAVTCHVECQDTPDCRYWTFYQDDGTCLLYSETCNVGPTPCTISGEVSATSQAKLGAKWNED